VEVIEGGGLSWLGSGPNLNKLDLTLVSLPVDFQLLGDPVADGAGAELLLGESYIRNLLGAFVELDSRHLLLGDFGDS